MSANTPKPSDERPVCISIEEPSASPDLTAYRDHSADRDTALPVPSSSPSAASAPPPRKHRRRVGFRITNASEPPESACCARHLIFLIADAMSEAMVLCFGRRVCLAPWRVMTTTTTSNADRGDAEDGDSRQANDDDDRRQWKDEVPNNSSSAPFSTSAPPFLSSSTAPRSHKTSLLRSASPDQARPILQKYRDERRTDMRRICFLLVIALALIAAILLVVAIVSVVVAPRYPPSEKGLTNPLSVIWMWQAHVLDRLGVIQLPFRQRRYPYNPPRVSLNHTPAEFLNLFGGNLTVVPSEHTVQSLETTADEMFELQAWLATLAQLDDNHNNASGHSERTASAPPPPAGSSSWVDALASFLRGDAVWEAAVRGAERVVSSDDVAADAAASVALRVLRARVGYARADGADAPETEARQPMDDVALLQWRHVLSASVPGDASSSSSPLTSAASAAAKVRLYGASSVLNRRFYYGVRRLERAVPYASSSSVETTKAWYDAVAGSAMWSVHGDAGAADADATSRANSVRLRVADVSAAYADEVDAYESHGDVLPPRADTRADVPTVFVSLASYRDAQCPPTLVDLFRKAKNAHRVYVGLAEQNSATDLSCLAPLELHEPSACLAPAGVSEASSDAAMASVYGGGALRGAGGASGAVAEFRRSVCFYAEHVRVRMIDAGVAKGPTYGRYMAMLLYRGESLTLVLDSHNRFTPFWDTLATHQYYRYNDPKTVLSHYPGPLELPLPQNFHYWRRETTYLCRAYFLVNLGFLRLDGAVVEDPVAHAQNNAHNLPFVSPRSDASHIDPATNFRLPQPWVAGGFLFANSSIMREVPFDPHLPYLFDGEETMYSVRLWTHGYNIFSPVRNIVYHYYIRKGSPSAFGGAVERWLYPQGIAHRRIQFLLHTRESVGSSVMRVLQNTTEPTVVVDVERYGTGKARTVDQWYAYAGADPVRLDVDGRWCARHMYGNHKDLLAAQVKANGKGLGDEEWEKN